MTDAWPHDQDIDTLCINTIRTLSIDAVQAANSGHPGTPMALAPLVYTLWNRVMRFDPQDPIWPNRDRFVLSNGHASMLLWSVLHLTRHAGGQRRVRDGSAQPSVTLDDIRRFRQLGSKAPGHPEYHWVSGVETTTGPLGQGIATSVGMAIAQKWLASALQPARLRHLRLRHLRRLRRRLPDGGRRLGGGVARRPSRPRQPLLDLRQQPHHDRGQHAASRSPRTSRRASSATAGTCCASATPTTSTRIEHALARVPADARAGRRSIILDSHIGYGSPHQQDTAAAHGEPLGDGGGPPDQARLRLARGREVPGARRRARALRRRHRRARRGGARGVDRALRRVPREVSRARDRDRPDAAARAAGRLGPQPAGVSRRRRRASPAATRRARC